MLKAREPTRVPPLLASALKRMNRGHTMIGKIADRIGAAAPCAAFDRLDRVAKDLEAVRREMEVG